MAEDKTKERVVIAYNVNHISWEIDGQQGALKRLLEEGWTIKDTTIVGEGALYFVLRAPASSTA